MSTEEATQKIQASKKEKNTFLLLGSSLGLLLQLGGLILQSLIILLQSFDSGLQKLDLFRLLPRRLLKSSHLLKLLSLVSCQLKTFSSAPKELGLLNDLLSQNLSTKHSQYKSTRPSNSTTRVQKDTHNKRRMAAQDPLGNVSRSLDRLLHLLPRHLLRGRIKIGHNRRTLRLILILLI